MITEEQKKLVQGTWGRILPISDTVAALFYARLFELDPSLRTLFSADMTEQGRKLMDTITVAVKGLHHLEALTPAMQELGRRHLAYHVKGEHYVLVGTSLMDALEKGLGSDFTPGVKDAWFAAYTVLADIMKNAAEPPPATAAA